MSGQQMTQNLTLAGLLSDWKPPLSTRGRYIVDADGKRFRLKSGNFHGASGTYTGQGNYDDPKNHHAGEVAYQTVLCLDRVPLEDLVNGFLELGINSIRLPFSNEMIQTTTIVPDHALSANPQLHNKTPLEVYDAVVEALTSKGLAVILNNHTVKSLWCCGLDENSRWNLRQTTQDWIDAWVFMVQRYKTNSRVVGADLYNEVRRDLLQDPTWGGGNQEADWYSASMQAAVRIQREADPDILIIIEGINWVGVPIPGVPHYRPELQPVSQLSHALPHPDKLVYNAHFYAYTGPNSTGADSGFGSTGDPSYGDLSPLALNATVHQLAGLVATSLYDVQMHYTAPVWISEFGVGGRNDNARRDRDWWSNFINLLVAGDWDYSVWPLVGWQENGQGDLWAFNAYSSKGQRLSILDQGDWRLDAYRKLARDGNYTKAGLIDVPETWRMLAPDWGSQVQSNAISAEAPLIPGEMKAACPDGLRLHGLTHSESPRGLCTDAHLGRMDWYKRNATNFSVVTDERYVSKPDWASGYTKLQCPTDNVLIGYSFTEKLSKAAICAPIQAETQGQQAAQRTVWFDKTSAAGASTHGSFASSNDVAVGVCNDDELLVGYAFTTKHGQGGIPSALLCRGSNASSMAVNGSSTHHNGAAGNVMLPSPASDPGTAFLGSTLWLLLFLYLSL